MDTELDSAADVDTAYEDLIILKGKRAQRRLDFALREPFRLRAWLNANDMRWWFLTYRNSTLYKQQVRAEKHSCHSMHHGYHQWEKHHRNRRARYDMRDTINRMIKGQQEI